MYFSWQTKYIKVSFTRCEHMSTKHQPTLMTNSPLLELRCQLPKLFPLTDSDYCCTLGIVGLKKKCNRLLSGCQSFFLIAAFMPSTQQDVPHFKFNCSESSCKTQALQQRVHYCVCVCLCVDMHAGLTKSLQSRPLLNFANVCTMLMSCTYTLRSS